MLSIENPPHTRFRQLNKPTQAIFFAMDAIIV